jgi:hypothetical protein
MVQTLESLVEEIELENSTRVATDPLVKKMLGVVEDFLKTHRVLCYGGTAINNLLPKDEQFYNPDQDIPDYDFFSETPQEHAALIADKLHALGIENVEVKPGMHLGTFKVFSAFHGVADVTHLDKTLFNRLWKDDVTVHGIHYVPPNFLRMSMYLELSRPKGDVSRWVKVYKRLQLLNKYYPMTCPGDFPASKDLTDERKKAVVSMLKHHPVVLLGMSAAEVHDKHTRWATPVILLANKSTIDAVTREKKTRVVEGTEVIPNQVDVLGDHDEVVMRFYETQACHSYHLMKDHIRVASIPTLLQFFYAYVYSNATEREVTRILCVAQRLVELSEHENKRHFPLLTPKDCLGTQETLLDMKKHRSELYTTLGKHRESPDFLQYFFTYNPATDKTRRHALLKKIKHS